MYNKIQELPRLKDVLGMLTGSTMKQVNTITNNKVAVFEKGSSIEIEVKDEDSLYFGKKIVAIVKEEFESITYSGAKQITDLIEEELDLYVSPYDIIYPLIEMNGDKF